MKGILQDFQTQAFAGKAANAFGNPLCFERKCRCAGAFSMPRLFQAPPETGTGGPGKAFVPQRRTVMWACARRSFTTTKGKAKTLTGNRLFQANGVRNVHIALPCFCIMGSFLR